MIFEYCGAGNLYNLITSEGPLDKLHFRSDALARNYCGTEDYVAPEILKASTLIFLT
jgi:hypothetical protein